MYIYRETEIIHAILWCSESCDCTKTNMIDEMPCGYGTLRTTGVRIWHQVSRRACAEVSAALEVSHRPSQTSQQLQNLTILIVKSRSIPNAPPSLQVLPGASENALAESDSTLQRSRGSWKHLEVHRGTGEGYWSVWEVCVWLPDQITFCWCAYSVSLTIINIQNLFPKNLFPALNDIILKLLLVCFCQTLLMYIPICHFHIWCLQPQLLAEYNYTWFSMVLL